MGRRPPTDGLGRQVVDEGADGGRVERALDGLDAFVQGLLGVVRAGSPPVAWARIGPVSISRWATWTVVPVSLTPAARASRTACHPGNAGSSAGWVLRMRPGKASCTGWARTVPNPAITTTSTPAATRASVTARVYALAVEPGAEAAEVGPVDQDRGDAGGPRPRRGPGTGGRRLPGRPGDRWPGWPRGWCRSPRPARRSGQVTRSASACRSGGHGRTLPAPPAVGGPGRRARRTRATRRPCDRHEVPG